MIQFRDRRDAGKQLADRLEWMVSGERVLVLGIPRGGVVVAAEVAHRLHAPLDVILTHKLGAPMNPELAIGAVASDGTMLVDESIIRQLHIPRFLVERERKRQLREIERRAQLFRGKQPPPKLEGTTTILVDDGVATGATTITAMRAVRAANPMRLILAVPVAPPQTIPALRAECDELVLLDAPEGFQAVGNYYEDFIQVEDQQVVELLKGNAT